MRSSAPDPPAHSHGGGRFHRGDTHPDPASSSPSIDPAPGECTTDDARGLRKQRLSLTRRPLPSSHQVTWRLPPTCHEDVAPRHYSNMAVEYESEECNGYDFEEEGVSQAKKKLRARSMAIVLVALAGLAGVMYRGHPISLAVAARRLKGVGELTYADLLARLNAADYTKEDKERVLAVAKSKWPKCVSNRLSAIQCKNMIDQEVVENNTENDRFIRTLIVGKRNQNDPLSNSIVIQMDDYDRVLGRDGDGLIYYDFEWDGAGVEASKYQQRKIPPIIAEEVDPNPTYDSIEVNIVPLRILGAATDDAIAEYSTDPIAGGVKIVDTATNTAAGDIKLDTALSESVTIAAAGTRPLGPYDCTGLTGRDCCLLVKHKVRDADTKGRAVQCYLDYAEGTVKRQALINARGKKVFIYENHKGRITKEPKVVGDWPQGVSNFETWIQDGGGLSNGQMKLIHGEDWVPPGQA